MKPLICFSIAAMLIANACKPAADKKDPCDTCNDNTALLLKDTLSPAVAKRLVRNYDGRVHYMGPLPGVRQSDTRCVWFSSVQLKALLKRISEEGGNGVRFYMATYDSVAKPRYKVPDRIRNYSTLVMVSTRDSVRAPGDTVHFDYYTNGPKRRGAILTATPENRGEICPPPSNCAADGATLLEP